MRNRQIQNLKFHRQFSVGAYVVDFICLEKKLIIEVDGGQHAANQKPDMERTRWLEGQGFKVIRFWNNEVLDNLAGVLKRIIEKSN